MPRIIALALAAVTGLALAACDPCAAALEIHLDRCASGESAESCLWVDGYMAAGTCPG